MAKTISFIFFALGFVLLPFSFFQVDEAGNFRFIVFTLNDFGLAVALIAIGYILKTQTKRAEIEPEK